jgi:hypothetical protein
MTAIEVCRTEALGGHLERCDQCGHERNAYNSCRDRHCPKCQGLAREQWIQDRQSELLNVPYFHVVFTVPEQIAAIAYQNKEVVYGVLLLVAVRKGATFLPAPSAHLRRAFLSFHIVSERSSPSRVCFAAPNNGAPLTAPGRSKKRLLIREKGSI